MCSEKWGNVSVTTGHWPPEKKPLILVSIGPLILKSWVDIRPGCGGRNSSLWSVLDQIRNPVSVVNAQLCSYLLGRKWQEGTFRVIHGHVQDYGVGWDRSKGSLGAPDHIFRYVSKMEIGPSHLLVSFLRARWDYWLEIWGVHRFDVIFPKGIPVFLFAK
jgi:hypothetical protein